MTHGALSLQSQPPQVLQCRANISLHPANIESVGGDPITSTTTGGVLAISLIGPINFFRQNSAPFLSRTVHAYMRKRTIPGSNFGIIAIRPNHNARRFLQSSVKCSIATSLSKMVNWRGSKSKGRCSNLKKHSPRTGALP
jgi:hypothetical protein